MSTVGKSPPGHLHSPANSLISVHHGHSSAVIRGCLYTPSIGLGGARGLHWVLCGRARHICYPLTPTLTPSLPEREVCVVEDQLFGYVPQLAPSTERAMDEIRDAFLTDFIIWPRA